MMDWTSDYESLLRTLAKNTLLYSRDGDHRRFVARQFILKDRLRDTMSAKHPIAYSWGGFQDAVALGKNARKWSETGRLR